MPSRDSGQSDDAETFQLNIGEVLLNNLRHTQHRTGQLTVLLRRHAHIRIDWLGTKYNQPPPPTS